MIKLKIKREFSPDIKVHAWEPESNEEVYFLLELEIGESEDERADLFQIVIATPEGLRKHAKNTIISERATLVLSEFSWVILRNVLGKILLSCSAENWNESVLKLQRYFRWEYEDYK